MKKLIAVLTILLFLSGPIFLTAQGMQGYQSGGKHGSVKAKKVEKKSVKSKKKASKKTKKLNVAGKPIKDVGTMPKSQR
jgi:hypothetical protein